MLSTQRAHPGPERALLQNELTTILGGGSPGSPKEYLLAKSYPHGLPENLQTPFEMNDHEDIV